MKGGFILLYVLFFASVISVHAELTIEITRGYEAAIPIAIVPFEGEESLTPFSSVISNDLERSGSFQPIPSSQFPERPVRSGDVTMMVWRNLKVESIVVGRVQPLASQQYQVVFELLDVYKGQRIVGKNSELLSGGLFLKNGQILLAQEFVVHANDARKLAHRISDLIYEKLTGEKGVASTRIAYVSLQGDKKYPEYRLEIADSDGFNPRIIMRSKKPLLSPDWSPDGSKIAYVSFENGRPEIYVQHIASGSRENVAAFPGLNTAPAWSKDGQKLALTLSKDGNSEIYVLDLATKRLQRITRDGAVDTEPAWSPDGSSLIFTSDRGGSPQIYQFSFEDNSTKRLTFEGDYNARGRFTSDGKNLIMVHRQNGQFHIAMQELEVGVLYTLSEGGFDESPSVAPNGKLIVYASKKGDRGLLSTVTVDTKVKLRLPLQGTEVREPAWSPILIGLTGVSL